MKYLQGRRGFDIITLESPARSPGPGQVRVQVLACGVCGTDLHFLRQKEDYTPLGHEICARVLENGEGAVRFPPGRQVVAEDQALCGVCDACKSGRPCLCRSGPSLDGQSGMGEELVLDERLLHDAEGLDPAVAAMTEPLAVAIRCVDTLDPAPGSSLLIYGLGAIGLFCLAYARLRGVTRVVMAARDAGSRRNRASADIALDFGADGVLFTALPAFREEALRGGSYDNALVAAPPPLVPDAMGLVGYGGKVLACGVTFDARDARAELDVNAMVFEKKALLTAIAEPALQFSLALRLLRSGRIDAGRAITHRVPLAEAATLKTLFGQDSSAVKAVVVPG